jgi:hypothetical protein
MCTIFVLLIAGYAYMQWGTYRMYQKAIDINEGTEEILKENVADVRATYLENKNDFTALQKNMEETLKEVFPMDDNYTELTRAFDSFEESTHRSNNPFVISNIDFQEIQLNEENNYKYLPLRMTITSSEKNFTEFLHYIETSGSLVDEIRLMDIQSIRMNFSEAESDEGAKTETISFSVKLHAYFQNI